MRVRRRRQRPWRRTATTARVSPGTRVPGWASYDNSIVDNTFNQNAAGVVVEGAFAPNFQGLSPDPNAAYSNNFYANTWSGAGISNFLAGVVDFSGSGNAPPIFDQYGNNDPNPVAGNTPADSCDPTVGGGSALEQGIAGASSWACG